MPDTLSPEYLARQVSDLSARVQSMEQHFDERTDRLDESIRNFGGRIGKLEQKNEVQDEQVNQIKESIKELKDEMRSGQADQKESLNNLRSEHKEAMTDLKHTNKEILDEVSKVNHSLLPIMHDIDSLKSLKAEVEEIKSKPMKTWESIKQQGLGWGIAILLGLVAAALGLSKFA